MRPALSQSAPTKQYPQNSGERLSRARRTALEGTENGSRGGGERLSAFLTKEYKNIYRNT